MLRPECRRQIVIVSLLFELFVARYIWDWSRCWKSQPNRSVLEDRLTQTLTVDQKRNASEKSTEFIGHPVLADVKCFA